MKYIADFQYVENGETVVEDVKGFRTEVYKMKKETNAFLFTIYKLKKLNVLGLCVRQGLFTKT